MKLSKRAKTAFWTVVESFVREQIAKGESSTFFADLSIEVEGKTDGQLVLESFNKLVKLAETPIRYGQRIER